MQQDTQNPSADQDVVSERGFRGIWMPARIYLSTDLSAMERLFMVEIESLASGARGCYAGNAHFANRFDLTDGRASQIINELAERGYVRIEIIRQGKKVVERRVFLTAKGAALWLPPELENDVNPFRKCGEPPLENAEEKSPNSKIPNEDSTRKAIDDDLFEKIWQAYPHWENRKNKKLARERFGKLSNKRKDLFLKAVKIYSASLADRDMQYVPGLEVWISKGTCEVWLQQAAAAPAEKSAEEKRASKIRLFLVTKRWDYNDGPFPTDAEVAAAEAAGAKQ